MRHSAYLLLAMIAGGCILDRAGDAVNDAASSTTVTTGGGAATIAVVTNDVSSTTITTGGGMGGDGGMTSGGGMGGLGGAGGSGGGPDDPLSDDGLVVRYFLDEAASGTAPAVVADAAPFNQLDLVLDYGMGNLAFSEPLLDQRGLTWLAAGDMGVASAAVNNKIINRIGGDQRFTIELVADIDGLMSGGSRPFVIGKSDMACSGQFCDELGLRLPTSSDLEVLFNDNVVGIWPAPWMAESRCVIHVIINSTAGNPANRARLFVNGAAVTPKGNVTVGANETLGLSNDGFVALGNRDGADRSPMGTIHYVALYDVVFNATRALTHSSRLLTTDDTDWP